MTQVQTLKKYSINDIVTLVGGVMTRLDSLETTVKQEIKNVREENVELFGAMKADFNRLENRLTGVESRLIGVEDRLAGVEDRLIGVEGRVTGIESRLEDVEVSCTQNTVAIHTLEAKMDIRFDKLEKTMFADVNALTKDSGKQALVLRKHARRIRALEAARA